MYYTKHWRTKKGPPNVFLYFMLVFFFVAFGRQHISFTQKINFVLDFNFWVRKIFYTFSFYRFRFSCVWLMRCGGWAPGSSQHQCAVWSFVVNALWEWEYFSVVVAAAVVAARVRMTMETSRDWKIIIYTSICQFADSDEFHLRGMNSRNEPLAHMCVMSVCNAVRCGVSDAVSDRRLLKNPHHATNERKINIRAHEIY